MAKKLIIRFHEHSNELVDWALVDSNGEPTQIETNAPIQDIAPSLAKNELVILIPSTLLTLTSINIPKTTYNKLVQAIPFAIEDDTINNVTNLHFAIGDRNNDDSLNVAYVEDELMSNWLASLETLKNEVISFYPDNLLIPVDPNSWSIFIDKDMALVRTSKQAGFSIETESLYPILQKMLKEHRPNEMVIYNAKHSSKVATKLKELDISLSFKEKNNYFEIIKQELFAPTAINLLQGKYKQKTKFLKLGTYWQLTVKLMVLWLVILIAGKIAQLGYLKYEKTKLHHQIIKLYQQIYPAATTLGDPRAKLSAEINKYQSPFQNKSFLYLLGQTGKILHEMPSLKIEKLAFSENKLSLQISTINFANLDTFSQKLSAQRIQVKRDKAYTKNKKVVAELTMRAQDDK